MLALCEEAIGPDTARNPQCKVQGCFAHSYFGEMWHTREVGRSLGNVLEDESG